jgi:hypothetical protein
MFMCTATLYGKNYNLDTYVLRKFGSGFMRTFSAACLNQERLRLAIYYSDLKPIISFDLAPHSDARVTV